MKYNQKGFTLIELLAVIAILAIIALITTPAILNVIEDARVNGAKDKAWGTIDAVKQTYAQAALDSSFDDTDKTATFTTDMKVGARDVQMSGDRPKSGSVTIHDNGKLTCLLLEFGGNGTYYCTTNDSGTKMCCNRKATDNTVKTNEGCN